MTEGESQERPQVLDQTPHDTTSEARAGWRTAPPETLPRPTYWPIVMALGIVFLFWGTQVSYYVSGVGLLLCSLALAGWIGELRRES